MIAWYAAWVSKRRSSLDYVSEVMTHSVSQTMRCMHTIRCKTLRRTCFARKETEKVVTRGCWETHAQLPISETCVWVNGKMAGVILQRLAEEDTHWKHTPQLLVLVFPRKYHIEQSLACTRLPRNPLTKTQTNMFWTDQSECATVI